MVTVMLKEILSSLYISLSGYNVAIVRVGLVSQDTSSVRPTGNGYQRLPADPRGRTSSTIVDDKDFAQFSHSSSNKFM